LDGTVTKVSLQVGDNATTNDVIEIEDIFGKSTASALGVATDTIATAFVPDNITGLQTFVTTVDTALEAVQTKRTAIGAIQNRLDSASASLTTTIENLTSSKSTIMDADIAAESSEYINGQILQQAAVSLLVQANQAPQAALSLV
ncbi:flagellin FliC, partial [bacterium]|nr:flagellin FliC [bacterium]